jgi:hypothetical protein
MNLDPKLQKDCENGSYGVTGNQSFCVEKRNNNLFLRNII